MASISLLMGSPLTIMFNAGSTPNTRGKRCVPPAPGIKPIFTLGQRNVGAGGCHAVVTTQGEL